MITYERQPIEQTKRQQRRGYAALKRTQTIRAGGGESSFGVSKRGLWLGSKSFDDAPFRVTMKGVIAGEAILLEGVLNVGEALQDLKDNIGSLSDIDANLGNVTAGTFTGGTVQTAVSGLRLRMSGSANSYQFLNDATVLAELKTATVPDSGTSGAMVQIPTDPSSYVGVAGSAGSGRAVMGGIGGYLAVVSDNVSTSRLHVSSNLLPTSNPGSGILWNDSGTVKVGT
jgi:hypothetical protein